MNRFEWIVLVLLLVLITILLFYRERKVSCFAGTNTLFDLNEMSFLPTEILAKLKESVNDVFIPSLRGVINRWWNTLDQNEKNSYIEKIDSYFKDASAENDKAVISVKIKSPVPNSPP